VQRREKEGRRRMERINKSWCLDKAIEITKAWAESSAGQQGKTFPGVILKDTYNVLKELSEDVQKAS
jgi:hypothetical protein